MDDPARTAEEIVAQWRSATGPTPDAATRVLASVIGAAAPAAAGSAASAVTAKVLAGIAAIGTAGAITLGVLASRDPQVEPPSSPLEAASPAVVDDDAGTPTPAASTPETTTTTSPAGPPVSDPTTTPRRRVPGTPAAAEQPETTPPDTAPVVQRPRALTQDELAAEARLVAAADRAIREGDLDRAHRAVLRHDAEFSGGMLGVEVETVRLLIACKRHHPNAARRAAAFLATHPRGGLAQRLRDACPDADDPEGR